jgi:hypothetical protein
MLGVGYSLKKGDIAMVSTEQVFADFGRALQQIFADAVAQALSQLRPNPMDEKVEGGTHRSDVCDSSSGKTAHAARKRA